MLQMLCNPRLKKVRDKKGWREQKKKLLQFLLFLHLSILFYFFISGSLMFTTNIFPAHPLIIRESSSDGYIFNLLSKYSLQHFFLPGFSFWGKISTFIQLNICGCLWWVSLCVISWREGLLIEDVTAAFGFYWPSFSCSIKETSLKISWWKSSCHEHHKNNWLSAFIVKLETVNFAALLDN